MIACKDKSTEEILSMPDVVERIEIYNEQTEKFKNGENCEVLEYPLDDKYLA